MRRVVEPEILDGLPPDDSAARRSRRDLVRINALMGNVRWIRRALLNRAATVGHREAIVEVGAGDGRLASSLTRDGWPVKAIDLAPRPANCAKAVEWIQGDVRDVLQMVKGRILVASLFWHHLPDGELESLAERIQQFNGLLATEPWRTRHASWLGTMLVPWVNHVTRHDLFVSIRAGFRPGDLPARWRLRPCDWQLKETGTAFGAYHLQAWRRR